MRHSYWRWSTITCASLIAVAFGLAPVAEGQEWDLVGGGIWSVPNNWMPNNVPNANNANAVFGNKITASSTVTVDAAIQVNSLKFNYTNTPSHRYTIALADRATLKFTGAANKIEIPATDVNGHTISANFEISNSDLTISNLSTIPLDITGNISESGERKVIVTGAGLTPGGAFYESLFLEGTNTHSGGTEITDAKVQFASDLALGKVNKPVSMNGGAIEKIAFAQVTVSRPIMLSGSGGAILGRNLPLDVGGVISGEGGLTVAGSTVSLLGDNTFTGDLRVGKGSENCTVQVQSDAAFGHANNKVLVTTHNSGLRALGNLTSARTFTVPSGATSTAKVDTNGFEITFSGTLDGTGSLTKVGTGALKLATGGTYGVGQKLNVNGGKVELDGSITTGAGIFVDGAELKAKGTVDGPLTVKSQGKLKPGKSPGTLEVVGNTLFESGSIYEFEINHTNGVAGSELGWDLLDVDGPLTIDASAGPIVVELHSLTTQDEPGPVSGFNPNQAAFWRFATASSGISGFTASAVSIDASSFVNSLAGGHFSILKNGNSLLVHFTPASVGGVPAVSEWALLGMAAVLAAAGAVVLRRRPTN